MTTEHATRREWWIDPATGNVFSKEIFDEIYPDFKPTLVREVRPGDRKALREAFVTCYPLMSGCSDAADRFMYELEKRGLLPEGQSFPEEKK